MHGLDISNNVTLYGQDTSDWCGAASAQMTRNGYPNSDRRLYQQQHLWNMIQVANSRLPQDQNWATDPHGLKGCLQNLNNLPAVKWTEVADASRDEVLFGMLHSMNVERYPSPVLVNQRGHWVVVVGWETDVEPTDGSNPTLQQIRYFDPWPPGVGADTMMSGAQWYAGPWNGAVGFTGTWIGNYVAIVERNRNPKGKLKADMSKRTGTKLLSLKKADDAAHQAINEHGLSGPHKYSILASEDLQSHPPLLVRDQPARRRPIRFVLLAPHYYIVPFGDRQERAERGGLLARIAVLVNAYTGAFEEVTAFGRPIHYLTQKEALETVTSAMGVLPQENVEATLMFQAGGITRSRSYPFWQVKVGRRLFYVDQSRVLHNKLEPGIAGN